MLSMRHFAQVGILATLLLGLGWQQQSCAQQPQQAPSAAPPVLGATPTKNAISNLKVRRDAKGMWSATFDVAYTGSPAGAVLWIDVPRVSDAPGIAEIYTRGLGNPLPATVGTYGTMLSVERPIQPDPITTQRVLVKLATPTAVLAVAEVAQQIDWPDWQSWMYDREVGYSTPEGVLAHAVSLIDQGDEVALGSARELLERLLTFDSKVAQAYVELARIAMKSNWGPEGLHQADSLLKSALLVQPGDVNAKILLGYVYTHQSRFAEADAKFADAAKSNPPNLWLWTNWGEMFAMQNQVGPAIKMYREAIQRPATRNTYDRARQDAYEHVIYLLEGRKDLDAAEALYKQRVADYGAGDCFGSRYAQFLLQVRGDTAGAIKLAKQAMAGKCGAPSARDVLGMANYVGWANASEPQRSDLLNQARVYMPISAKALRQLAASERTSDVVKQMIAAGERVDQTDNVHLNALAYALQERDYDAARRLLRMGASATTTVGAGNVPIALIPVLTNDLDGIRLLRHSGVDYSKITYQGMTGVDIAKRSGDKKLINALDPKASAI